MTKYMVLMHPNTTDTYVLGAKKTFNTVDEAVKEALAYGTDDFWVITKIEWQAQPTKETK